MGFIARQGRAPRAKKGLILVSDFKVQFQAGPGRGGESSLGKGKVLLEASSIFLRIPDKPAPSG